MVRRLLGWSAPSHAGRIRAGASPLGDLAAGECHTQFVTYNERGEIDSFIYMCVLFMLIITCEHFIKKIIK
jgi:hypothetical protein